MLSIIKWLTHRIKEHFMSFARRLGLATLVLAFAAPTFAADPVASAPDAASAPVKKPHLIKRDGRTNRWDTPTWTLMTPEEQKAHRAKMHGMKSFDECQAYVTEHHAAMAERAKEQGKQMPDPERKDVCKWLKKK